MTSTCSMSNNVVLTMRKIRSDIMFKLTEENYGFIMRRSKPFGNTQHRL